MVVGAISTDQSMVVEVCGKVMTVAEVDYDICRACQNGALPNSNHPAGLPDRLGALCNRSCVHSLEQSERVENRFDVAFRQRPVWQKDIVGRVSVQEVG